MGAKPSKPTTEEEHRIARKCMARRTAYAHCMAANKDDPSPCDRLETALVMCHAAELQGTKDASADHERCFTSLMNVGSYKSRNHCKPELEALKAGLRKHGLFPFKAGASA